MATSGQTSVKVTNWDTLIFAWQRSNYSIAGNYSDIYWEMRLSSTSYGRIDSSVAKDWSVNVAGNPYSGKNYVGIANNSLKILASGTTRVYHNNDGSKYLEYNFSQYFGITFSGNFLGTFSGSGGAWLDSIPRYANITSHYVESTGLDSITIRWATDNPRDWTQYSLNGGTWTNANDSVAGDNKSGVYTISGLQPNTQYNIRTRIKRTDSQLWTESGTIYGTTKDIAKISSLNNFNFGDNSTIAITNPSGKNVVLTIKVQDTVILTKNLSTGNNVIAFNDTELDTIYKKYETSNTISLTYSIITNNNSKYINSKTITCTLTGNAKVVKLGNNNEIKRAKIFLGNDNKIKRAVAWIKKDGIIKRLI